VNHLVPFRSADASIPLIVVVANHRGPQFVKGVNIGVLAVSRTSSLTPLIAICFSRASRCAAR
jgi:hypothetical protein